MPGSLVGEDPHLKAADTGKLWNLASVLSTPTAAANLQNPFYFDVRNYSSCVSNVDPATGLRPALCILDTSSGGRQRQICTHP